MDAGRSTRVTLRTAVLALSLPALTLTAAPAVAADVTPYRAQVFTQGYDTSKVATLTFDLDWRTGTADQIAASRANLDTVLRVFAANGIIGGFGMTGRFAEQNPAEARNIATQGHKIINHSWSHPDFMTLTQAQRWSQLDRTEAAFRAAGVSSAGWFRAPYRSGYTNAALNRDLALRGFYINADWTFDTTGYQGADWATVSGRIDRFLKPGAIVVMHVSIPSSDPGNLQKIIDKIKGQGYAFVSPFQAVTRGPIRTAYLTAGGQSSLGAATTGPMQATTAGTEVQWFQKGRLYHSAATGAHAVRGAILTKYRALGTAGSFLRYPTAGERPGAGGGWYSTFQGGSIYWSPATGAHEVHGAIRTRWLALGGEGGHLGYPRSDETAVSVGRAVQFQRGNAYWNSTDGAHVVRGGILTRYLALGGTGSRLGPPTSDEYAVAVGWRSDFRHGSLTWNSTTGTITVVYR
ncbi:uncharacterized protein with LGFP repeats [Actinoplanes campanulatus]|uniref:Uncharacterized protein with LGFP repeats n=1 Tax=Actinoplanes campanulatus TaxID=113559 RepID=A0A7W5FEL8_9ACTN|nr:polysaccharide deacetylase family protein [Actinoplanes campanulatus]MBB3095457.1 uncharacterized protein with LGFP repeats [Actinoplanes campanulatus]GGN09136.1 hypothetical protein GCM10010109_18250 [Actinoplanes campanulatus]GID36343.1 hypothetical protein Aca09nite_28490 [Actinoplanes campanulatus]